MVSTLFSVVMQWYSTIPGIITHYIIIFYLQFWKKSSTTLCYCFFCIITLHIFFYLCTFNFLKHVFLTNVICLNILWTTALRIMYLLWNINKSNILMTIKWDFYETSAPAIQERRRAGKSTKFFFRKGPFPLYCRTHIK